MRPVKRASMVLACLLLATCAAPAARAQHPQGLATQEEFRFPAGRDTVSLPFETRAEHIMIMVSVNGGRPLQMVFDTGMPSPGVLLYEGALVDSLGLAYAQARVQVGGGGGAPARQARLATGVSLRADALEIGGTVAIVMPPTPQLSASHDGIIGASLFQNLVVSLDHDRRIMTLTRRAAFAPPKGASEVKLDIVGRHAYVPVGLVRDDGPTVPLQLILDLGATHPVSLNRRSNAAIELPSGARATRIGRGMSGPMSGRAGRIPGIEIGGYRLSKVVATFPDSAFENPKGLDQRNGNLGSGVLGRFNLALDIAGARMFLTPNHRYGDPFEWDMSGLVLETGERGEITVAQVLADSPAADARIAPGEVLVAVDGVKADQRGLLSARQRFREEGRELALTLRQGGRERVVKLKLRRLV